MASTTTASGSLSLASFMEPNHCRCLAQVENETSVLVGEGQNLIFLIVPLKVMSGFRPLIKESKGTKEEGGQPRRMF